MVESKTKVHEFSHLIPLDKKRLYSLEIISGQIEVDEKILLQKINIGQVISKSNKYIICMLKINAVEELAKNKNCLNINNSVILKFLQF